MLPRCRSGDAGRAAAHPLPRRAQRRHRDRLRRHGPAPARRAPGLDGALGGVRRRRPSARREARASAADFLAGAAEAEVVVKPFRDELLPVRQGRRSRTSSRRSKRDDEPDLVLTHHRARPAPGPPPGRRADLEHLPRPPDPRVRDPQVRGRSRARRTCYVPLAEAVAQRKIELILRSLRVAGAASAGSAPRPSRRSCALRGIECNAPRGLRRGVPRRQAGHLSRRRARETEANA